VGHWNLSQTEYPAIRRVMALESERMDDEALADHIGRVFPGTDAEDVEGIVRGLPQFGRKAMPLEGELNDDCTN